MDRIGCLFGLVIKRLLHVASFGLHRQLAFIQQSRRSRLIQFPLSVLCPAFPPTHKTPYIYRATCGRSSVATGVLTWTQQQRWQRVTWTGTQPGWCLTCCKTGVVWVCGCGVGARGGVLRVCGDDCVCVCVLMGCGWARTAWCLGTACLQRCELHLLGPQNPTPHLTSACIPLPSRHKHIASTNHSPPPFTHSSQPTNHHPTIQQA